jgi:SAM-dependent methyltransferase
MRKRLLLDVLERLKPRRILEIGCGTDALFRHWARFDRFVIVEPGSAFAAKARRDADGDERVVVVEGLIEEAVDALVDETFDVILVSGLLHEVPDPAAVLQCILSLCSSGTVVHVNVPNANSFHRLLALEMGLIESPSEISNRQRALQQQRTFCLADLIYLCEQSGFRVTEHGSYFIKPFTHSQMAELQTMGMLDARMLDGLFRLERHLPGLGSEIFVHLERRQ